jgi:hypothetical protein
MLSDKDLLKSQAPRPPEWLPVGEAGEMSREGIRVYQQRERDRERASVRSSNLGNTWNQTAKPKCPKKTKKKIKKLWTW